jgi:hypothetical protein
MTDNSGFMIFGIHVMENKVLFYSYYEGQAVKGSNEVLTFPLDFTEKYAPPTINTELFLSLMVA